MRTITKTFDLYEFDELLGGAQEKAISDHIDFEIEIMNEQSWLYLCALEAERLQTPWVLGSIIYENHKEDIIETIKVNEYLFFKDGEIIPIEYYPE